MPSLFNIRWPPQPFLYYYSIQGQYSLFPIKSLFKKGQGQKEFEEVGQLIEQLQATHLKNSKIPTPPPPHTHTPRKQDIYDYYYIAGPVLYSSNVGIIEDVAGELNYIAFFFHYK